MVTFSMDKKSLPKSYVNGRRDATNPAKSLSRTHTFSTTTNHLFQSRIYSQHGKQPLSSTPKECKSKLTNVQSGFDQNRVYSVHVLQGETLPDSPAETERLFFEFLSGFRVGGEFIYRDRLRSSLLLNHHSIDVDLRDLVVYNDELAQKVQEQPGEMIPLVSFCVPSVRIGDSACVSLYVNGVLTTESLFRLVGISFITISKIAFTSHSERDEWRVKQCC